MTDKSSADLKHGDHPAISQVAMLVNDIRLDFDQGRGTLAEVADRIIETVLNPKPTKEYQPVRLREPGPDPLIATLRPGDRIRGNYYGRAVEGRVVLSDPERDNLLLMDAGTPPPVLRWKGSSQCDVVGIEVIARAEPPAEVTTVVDNEGERWHRSGDGWMVERGLAGLFDNQPWSWNNLNARYGPLTWSEED